MKCWNCGSPRYVETVAVESCPACGIGCDYHGDGMNPAYRQALARKEAAEADAEWRQRQEDEEWSACDEE